MLVVPSVPDLEATRGAPVVGVGLAKTSVPSFSVTVALTWSAKAGQIEKDPKATADQKEMRRRGDGCMWGPEKSPNAMWRQWEYPNFYVFLK